MGSARPAGRAFSPLDEELALLPGSLTPSLQESVVRLGTWMPFARAVAELAYFTGTVVARPTVERLTEGAGAAYVQFQTQEVERLERETPLPPAGPVRQFVSVDGANVPLVGGEWAEVKTVVIGEVQPPVERRGEMVVETQHLSYFSRLTDSDTFQRLALVETHRRGVERAGQVVAVTDGAEWIQKFIDFHCPDAVRILDFPHAAERVALIGQTVWGEHAPQTQTWLTAQLHQLKHAGPTPLLAELHRLLEPPGYPTLQEHVTYLEKRQAAMQYPHFQAEGWPIGDGAVESGNKLVVEARLKGSGMHWARPHVDPMLALRNIACNDRWAEAWPQIMTGLRQQDRQRRTEHRQRHRAHEAARAEPIPAPCLAISNAARIPAASSPASVMSPNAPDSQPCPVNPATPIQPAGPWRPPANHPWRHMPIGRARFKPFAKHTHAKT